MEILISLFAAFGLSFLLTQMDGPFGILAKARFLMASIPYVGVFFYKLISCSYCNGFYAGTLIYLFNYWGAIEINTLICWGLACAGFNLIMYTLYNKFASS